MQMGGGKRGAGINVTPLIDVVLVLLIIFMVITPMAQSGKDVQLPRADATSGEQSEKLDPLVVTVDEEGTLWLEERPVDEAEIKAALAPRRPVVVRGDERARVGDVRRAMRALQAAGAQQIAMAVQGGDES